MTVLNSETGSADLAMLIGWVCWWYWGWCWRGGRREDWGWAGLGPASAAALWQLGGEPGSAPVSPIGSSENENTTNYSILCSGWHAWVTLNRIIFRGKIHDKCHTLVTVTRHGTHTAHFYLYHHIKLKSLNPTLVIVSSLKHNFAINFLLLLASYFPVTRHSSVSRPLKPRRHETPAAIYLGPGTGPVWPGPALLGSCAPVISVSYSAISTHNCGQGQMEHCNWNPKTCGVIVIKSLIMFYN